MKRLSLIVCAIGITAMAGASSGADNIIDHTRVDGVARLPRATMNAIGKQRWFFSHASVGANMISGMNDLHDADRQRYQLVVSDVNYNGGQGQADTPGTTKPGTIYECNRGNPGWANKLEIFDRSVRSSGWCLPNVDVAMDKFCYIDQEADPAKYLDTMAALEKAYPDTRFVYVTMPLTTSEDADNCLRNRYNDAVRQFARAQGKLLFDIADIESHNPRGQAVTFTHDGATYQKLYDGYSDDGGHLNAAGQKRVALGWYAVGAAIVKKR